MSKYQAGGKKKKRAAYDNEYDDDEPRKRRKSDRDYPAEERPTKRRNKRRWKIVLEDIDTWDKYTFTFFANVGIGRGKDGNNYEKYLPIVTDARVSKKHCVIVHKNDKLYLKDDGSRNGTFLNGTRIDHPVEIQRDDIIGIGETRLEVKRVLRESE